MLRRTKRSRVFRTLVLSSLLLLFPAAVGASSSPAELMNRSLSAAGAQHSVHLFGQVTSSGVVVDIVADVGLTRGEQKIGIAETGPNGRHGLATVVVTDGAAY